MHGETSYRTKIRTSPGSIKERPLTPAESNRMMKTEQKGKQIADAWKLLNMFKFSPDEVGAQKWAKQMKIAGIDLDTEMLNQMHDELKQNKDKNGPLKKAMLDNWDTVAGEMFFGLEAAETKQIKAENKVTEEMNAAMIARTQRYEEKKRQDAEKLANAQKIVAAQPSTYKKTATQPTETPTVAPKQGFFARLRNRLFPTKVVESTEPEIIIDDISSENLDTEPEVAGEYAPMPEQWELDSKNENEDAAEIANAVEDVVDKKISKETRRPKDWKKPLAKAAAAVGLYGVLNSSMNQQAQANNYEHATVGPITHQIDDTLALAETTPAGKLFSNKKDKAGKKTDKADKNELNEEEENQLATIKTDFETRPMTKTGMTTKERGRLRKDKRTAAREKLQRAKITQDIKTVFTPQSDSNQDTNDLLQNIGDSAAKFGANIFGPENNKANDKPVPPKKNKTARL